MAVKYAWRSGYASKLEPERAAAELARIRRENDGALTRQAVLDAATDEDHPFHDEFDWDDDLASERWRLYQAGTLIRAVRIIRPRTAARSMYVRVRTLPSEYEDFDVVIATPNLYSAALISARHSLALASERVNELVTASATQAQTEQASTSSKHLKAAQQALG